MKSFFHYYIFVFFKKKIRNRSKKALDKPLLKLNNPAHEKVNFKQNILPKKRNFFKSFNTGGCTHVETNTRVHQCTTTRSTTSSRLRTTSGCCLHQNICSAWRSILNQQLFFAIYFIPMCYISFNFYLFLIYRRMPTWFVCCTIAVWHGTNNERGNYAPLCWHCFLPLI